MTRKEGPEDDGLFQFPPTPWSAIINAPSHDTLGIIFSHYRQPMLAYIRCWRSLREDPEDVVQGFFESLLSKDGIKNFDPDRGTRLRCYLCVALKHYMQRLWRRHQTQKAGGGKTQVPLESVSDPANTEPSPDEQFDRNWGLTVLERGFRQLELDYTQRGRSDLFEALYPYLAWNSSPTPYQALAEQLGKSLASIKVEVHRMRKRYKKALYSIIAATVETENEIEEELQFLISTLAGKKEK